MIDIIFMQFWTSVFPPASPIWHMIEVLADFLTKIISGHNFGCFGYVRPERDYHRRPIDMNTRKRKTGVQGVLKSRQSRSRIRFELVSRNAREIINITVA
jgi:hypothetical protein